MAKSKSKPDEIIVTLYEQSPRTVDDLPYTDDFEALYRDYLGESGLSIDRHEFWHRLTLERKNGNLTRKGRGG